MGAVAEQWKHTHIRILEHPYTFAACKALNLLEEAWSSTCPPNRMMYLGICLANVAPKRHPTISNVRFSTLIDSPPVKTLKQSSFLTVSISFLSYFDLCVYQIWWHQSFLSYRDRLGPAFLCHDATAGMMQHYVPVHLDMRGRRFSLATGLFQFFGLQVWQIFFPGQRFQVEKGEWRNYECVHADVLQAHRRRWV